MKFWIVDAFTETLFGGNPAGVVLIPEDGEFPDDEIMRKTAAELRYSETAFVKKVGAGEFRTRYFTPAAEVDLCGHATVGTFCALQKAGLISAGETCLNHTLAGDLQVRAEEGFVMMEMGAPKDLGTIADPAALEELYAVMGGEYDPGATVAGIGYGDVSGAEGGGTEMALPMPRMISTGLPDIMLMLPSREALFDLKPDMAALTELSKKYDVVGVHAFALGEGDVTAHARNFAPLYDIDEEAATGTSSGAMTYYLYLNGLIGPKAECRFLQGETMGRPSVILSKLEGDPAGDCRIEVGGSAVILAQGEMDLL